MRILLINNVFPPGFIGGYELGALDVARGLQRAGHEVLVLTSDYFPDDDNQMPDLPAERVLQCTEPSRSLITVKANVEHGLFLNGHNIRMLVRTILRFAPDRVVCFNLAGLGVLGILRYLVSAGLAPVLYLMDDIFKDLRTANSEGQKFFHVFGGLGFLNAVDFILMSSNLAGQVETSIKMPIAHKTIVPGWFSAEPGLKDHAWTAPKPNHIVRFVFASRIAGHKGISLVLDAVRGVIARGRSDFLVDVFGAGDVAELLQGISAQRIGDQVHYQGCPAKDELALRLRDYDAMLFPTWEREPFGFIVSEAAWARCIPVITAGIGAAEWFLDDWDSLKISRTATDLTAAMLKLLAMPSSERQAMQLRSQKTAGYFLDFERAMNSIQNVIAQGKRECGERPPAARTSELALAVLDDMWGRLNRV